MIAFNSYIWHLYRVSAEGQEALDLYSDLLAHLTDDTIGPDSTGQIFAENVETILAYCADREIHSIGDAWAFFKSIATDGLPLRATDEHGSEQEIIVPAIDLIESLSEISVALYARYPEFFYPYLFGRFNEYQQICDVFGIPLPEIPKKRDFQGRLFYYSELCRSLYEFRRTYDLSPAELCAFLYAFAPHFIAGETSTALPAPLRVWIVGGGINDNGDPEFLDSADEQTTAYWQGNVDTKRGDIVLMYCVSPRSYIHSIWRAKSDGFIDPFFHFYSTIEIGDPIKTLPVTYADLRNDSVLSQNGLIRGFMQGINGRTFTLREYEAILNVMARKGQDISALPRLERLVPDGDEAASLEDERDVEVRLVEPFLGRLGYEAADWTRQMTVRMGSGEKVYPDYAFFARMARGEEQASMILETKYRIRTTKDLFKAYCQAKSYALRLQARIFMLAAVEGVWIFRSGDTGFDFENYAYRAWSEIYHPDVFPSISKIVGKQALHAKGRSFATRA